MSNKQRYKALIDNKEYTIVGHRPAEHLDAVVTLINQQYDQLKELAPELSLVDRSVLMTINAVSDQMLKENKIMQLEEEIKQLKQQKTGNQSAPKNNKRKKR